MSKVITTSVAKRRIEKHSPDSFELEFTGYTSVETEAAKLISQVKTSLDLRDIHDISDEVAEFLGTHTESLDLGGLKSLSQNAAKALAKNYRWLHMEIPELSNDAAAELAAGKVRLKLTGLTRLDDCPGHIALAKKLSNDRVIDRLYALKQVAKAVSDSVPEIKK